MRTIRLDIEYDGSRFAGWAAQPGLRTVQGELQGVLEAVLRAPVRLIVAGRTDAGVHAWGQVASFSTAAEIPPDLEYRLNGAGPRDIGVTAVTIAADDFDARRDALSRTYCYRLLARPSASPFEQRRALWWPYRFDHDAVGECSRALIGSHDFTAFTPTQTEHVHFEREILRAEWITDGDLRFFWISADAFMRNMVRVLVGTMLEVGGGRRPVEDFTRLLSGAPREEAGETAAPHGLYLASVQY